MALKAAAGYLKRVIDYRSFRTAGFIQRNLRNVAVPLKPAASGRIEAVGLGFTFDPVAQPYILERLVVLRDFIQGGWGTVGNTAEGLPEVRITGTTVGEVRIPIAAPDDLYVFDEIFLGRQYDLYPFGDEEPFVIDIGMNVGLASLFFAAIKGWEVLGLEPFPATFAVAQRNIEAWGLTGRITLREVGLAAATETIRVASNLDARSTNGLYGNLNTDRMTRDETIEIRLQDAAELFTEALILAKGRPILAKMDCEGAEYAIIDRLIESGVISMIPYLLIEYHRVLPKDEPGGHDPEDLIRRLKSLGFVVMRNHNSAKVGDLFAFRPPKEL